MKKLFCVLFCLALILSFAATQTSADNRNTTVYIALKSTSAYRYHRTADCSSLSRSIVGSVTLEEAASSGYTACTRCHPPIPDFAIEATPRPSTAGSNSSTDRAISANAGDTVKSGSSVNVGKILLVAFGVVFIGKFVYGVIVISIAEHKDKQKR